MAGGGTLDWSIFAPAPASLALAEEEGNRFVHIVVPSTAERQAYLELPLDPSRSRLRVAFRMRVADGLPYTSYLSVHTEGALVLYSEANVGTLSVVERNNLVGDLSIRRATGTPPHEVWHRIEAKIDLEARRFDLDVDALHLTGKSLEYTQIDLLSTRPRLLRIGAFYMNPSPESWAVDIDDVGVLAE